MGSIAEEFIYLLLASAVPTSIAILIPLLGAFWIFKVRERTASEGKIFEIGREIANRLESTNIRGPYDIGFDYYIDRARGGLGELNYEKALQELLRQHLLSYRPDFDRSEVARTRSAETVIAIAAARVQELIPKTVSWSGKGVAYSPFGVTLELRDGFFPFGTRLYRHWIEVFSSASRDIWAISNSRRFFLDALPEREGHEQPWRSREAVGEWLDQVDELMRELRPLHARLLALVQAIDTQIDLPRLGRDIFILSCYACLLAIVGFMAPWMLIAMNLQTLQGLGLSATATVLVYVLIVGRLKSAALPIREDKLQQGVFLLRVVEELRWMEERSSRFRLHEVQNVLSMASDLRLPRRVVSALRQLVHAVEAFNSSSTPFYAELAGRIRDLSGQFPTVRKNKNGIPVNIVDLVGDAFDCEGLRSRILAESANLSFEQNSHRTSQTIASIDLSSLTTAQRSDLCDRMESIRTEMRSLEPFGKTSSLSSCVQRARRLAYSSVVGLLRKDGSGVLPAAGFPELE